MKLTQLFAVAFILASLGLLPCAFSQSGSKNVTELPGKEEELPPDILARSSDEVVKYNGTELVARAGDESDKCRKACLAETSIDCRYYRYLYSQESCLLLASKITGDTKAVQSGTSGNRTVRENNGSDDHSTEPNNYDDSDSTSKPFYTDGWQDGAAGPSTDYRAPVQAGSPQPPGANQHATSHTNSDHPDTDKNQLIKEIRDLAQAHDATNSSVQDIDYKVAVVDENNEKIENKLTEVISHDKETNAQVKHIANKERRIEDAVRSLKSNLQRLGSEVVGVKISNNKINEELEHSDTKSPVLDRQLQTIQRELTNLKSQVEMNPTVFKITKNQRVLAEALESIDRELTIFERKLGHIDDISDEIGGRLTKEELHRKTLNGALQTLTSAVRTIRTDIDRLENPMSEENVKKTNMIKSIKSDIDVLIKNNQKLNLDSDKIKTELDSLLKDLIMVQQNNQEGKTSIAALVATNKNMKADFSRIMQDQEHMMTKIQTLATVYRSVLTALHNMEIKQIQVVHRMKQYERSMHKLSKDFLGKKMQAGDGSSEGHSISSNLTSYSNLLLSQRQMYSQLLSLQNDVRAIQGLAPITHSPPTTTSTTPQPTVQNGRLGLVNRLKDVHKLNSEIEDRDKENRRSQFADYDDSDHNRDHEEYEGRR